MKPARKARTGLFLTDDRAARKVSIGVRQPGDVREDMQVDIRVVKLVFIIRSAGA